jgi:hypothetical protein
VLFSRLSLHSGCFCVIHPLTRCCQTRYQKNLVSLGKAFEATNATFPHLFFVETVKLHWPDAPGDQETPRAANESTLEQCAPTENVVRVLLQRLCVVCIGGRGGGGGNAGNKPRLIGRGETACERPEPRPPSVDCFLPA